MLKHNTTQCVDNRKKTKRNLVKFVLKRADIRKAPGAAVRRFVALFFCNHLHDTGDGCTDNGVERKLHKEIDADDGQKQHADDFTARNAEHRCSSARSTVDMMSAKMPVFTTGADMAESVQASV